ncbi:Cytochrome b561 and DOMON domain-containing protein [Actinidia chinensis var. chinensis]|uniref:Cytochrome b561 and DOMON domain-containing protein n=1 Tax=Actinidia chinensis var. chinensis TaxID=1590841 RepID=A0A2R6RYI2_ACTCC|nr:Cytochrome b561 and DOMON domain-containing protein [Actinidia chinensis var. chinensis]
MKPILVFCILTCLLVPSLALLSSSFSSSPCSDFVFPNKKAFVSCTDLPTLNSFLHWTHKPSSRTLEIAYRHTGITSSKWVAWGINPTSPRMVGTQAIVAYQEPDGTMTVYTSLVPDNTFALNHVWQDEAMNGKSLGMHDLSGSHLQSMGTLNLTSGQASASHGGDSNTVLKIVSALIFRPAEDHKYRYIWNRFHHGARYTVLLLGFANIWIGFSIWEPAM